MSWPSATVTLGKDKLEGTMAIRLDTERPLITGTLAADGLNLSDLVAPFAQARTSSGPWSEEPIDLTQVTGSDLDLRLSAAAALARLRRSVLLIDAGEQRNLRGHAVDNYLGLEGISPRELLRRGRAEAKQAGAELREGRVTEINLRKLLYTKSVWNPRSSVTRSNSPAAAPGAS